MHFDSLVITVEQMLNRAGEAEATEEPVISVAANLREGAGIALG